MKKLTMSIIVLTIAGIMAFTPMWGEAQNIYKKEVLPNGLTVLIKSNPDSKVFAACVLSKGRSVIEPPMKTGISEFVNRMLTKGTENYSGAELSRKMDMHGMQLTLYDNPYIPYDDRYTTRSFAFIKMETIDEYADGAIELLAEIIRRPAFPENKIEEVRGQIMGILGMNSGSTYKNARDLFYKELFHDTPYEKTILGNPRTIGMINRDDLVQHHKKMYAPENMVIAVVTNLPTERCYEMISTAFSDMEKSGFDYPEYPKPSPVKATVKSHQQMDKDQVYIYMGNITPGIADPDFPALQIASAALSTRLKLELREEEGLAYSVGSGMGAYPGFGMFLCTMGTGYKNLDKALNGIKGEISKIRAEGITSEERINTTNNLWGSMLTRNLTRANQAYYMAVYEYYGAGYQHWDELINDLRAVTTREVQLVAEKYLPEDNYVLTTVGKK
ncbi:MAG: hypothetical protein GF307_02710 [candidate division Zixibacteria bacterium]|nr:hypothetical protein [candidate division Zixibacteria bacterium]